MSSRVSRSGVFLQQYSPLWKWNKTWHHKGRFHIAFLLTFASLLRVDKQHLREGCGWARFRTFSRCEWHVGLFGLWRWKTGSIWACGGGRHVETSFPLTLPGPLIEDGEKRLPEYVCIKTNCQFSWGQLPQSCSMTRSGDPDGHVKSRSAADRWPWPTFTVGIAELSL